MAKKPLNPDSVKGGGMPSLGRSSQAASAAANKRAGAGKTMADQFAAQFKKFQAQRTIRGSAISDYYKAANSARNKRLNAKFNTPGFDFGPLFKDIKKRGQ